MNEDTRNGQQDADCEGITGRLNRRNFLKITAAAGTVGMAGAAGMFATGCNGLGGLGGGTSDDIESVAAGLNDNIYTRLLGVRPHIGLHDHITRLGGSRMPPEVIEAMTEANRYFVDMGELHEAAGRRIAEIMGAEDAVVSAGAFASLLVGTAAVLTGKDEERIKALPNPTWPKVECLFQTPHRFFYDQVVTYAGMHLVEAGTREEFEAAITDRTAMLFALTNVETRSPEDAVGDGENEEPMPEPIMPMEIIEIGKRRGVPVMVDMAPNLPPRANLTRYLEAGADLVVVSGGKAIRGPNSAGIVAGRKDLIEAARMQNAPENGIGRGLKVGKEEIVGVVTALERFVALDESAEIAEWDRKAKWLAEQLQDIPGLEARTETNGKGYQDVVLAWDETMIPLSNDDVERLLREGDPRIITFGDNIRVHQVTDGELALAARRLRALFTTGG